jgi:hypothetical protein
MRLINQIAIALLLLFTTSYCYASDAKKAVVATTVDTKAAERLLDVLDLQSTLRKLTEQQLEAEIKANPEIAPFKGVMLDFLTKYLNYTQIKPGLSLLYTQAFSDQELNELTTFYQSPLGKKSLKLVPLLTEQGGKLGEQLVTEHLPELREMIEAEAQRIKMQSEAEPKLTK